MQAQPYTVEAMSAPGQEQALTHLETLLADFKDKSPTTCSDFYTAYQTIAGLLEQALSKMTGERKTLVEIYIREVETHYSKFTAEV